MKTPCFVVLLAAAAYCQDAPSPAAKATPPAATAPAPPVSKPLAKEDGLELENIALQSVVNQKNIESIQSKFQEIQRDQQDLQKSYNRKIWSVCIKAGISAVPPGEGIEMSSTPPTDCDVQKAPGSKTSSGEGWTATKRPAAPVSGQITGAGQPQIAPPRGNK